MGATSGGEIALDLTVNRDRFEQQLSGIKSVAKKAGKAIAGAFAFKKILDFGKESIELGSDLAEVQNVVDVTFTTMSDKVNNFAQSAATSFGMSETMAKKYMGTFGAMAKAFGFSEEQAYDMSTALTGLSGDVASFYNLSQDEAYTKLKSVFTGETESLKDLGVVMTQTALDQYALANGFGKTTANMSEQEKVALRYKFVQDQLATASGDFARTQDGWANQTRVLSLQIDSLKANIGQGLINVLSPVLVLINKLIAKFVKLGEVFKSFTEKLTGNKSSDDAGSSMQAVAEGADTAAENVEAVGDAAEKSAKKAKKSVMGFDQFNKISEEDSDSSPGSSGAANITNNSLGNAAGSGIGSDTVLDKTSGKLDKIARTFDRVRKAFSKGFNMSIGDTETNIGKIRKGLSGIKDSLIEIATDSEVTSSLGRLGESLLTNLGAVVGGVINVGTSIATNLATGINNTLNQKKKVISSRLSDMFNNTAEWADIGTKLISTVSEIFSDVITGDTAISITTSIGNIFTEAITGAGVLLTAFGRDVCSLIATPIIENKDKIKEALLNTLEPVKTALQGAEKMVTGVFDKAIEVYDEKIKPAVDDVTDALSDIVGGVLDSYNKYIAPAIKEVGEKVSDMYEKHIGPCIEEAIEVIGNLAKIIGKLSKKFIAPLVKILTKILAATVGKIIKVVGTLLVGAIDAVVDSIKGLLKAINYILDGSLLEDAKKFFSGFYNSITVTFKHIGKWFKNKFSGAWKAIKSVFEPKKVKKFFKDIWEKVTAPFKKVATWFRDKFKKAWQKIKDTFNINTIKKYFKDSYEKVRDAFANVATWFRDKFKKAWENIKNVFSVERFKEHFKKLKDKITGVFTTISSWFRRKFSNAWKNIKAVFSLERFKNHFVNLKGKVTAPFSEIGAWFKGKFDDAWTFIKGAFSLDNISKFFSDAWEKIKSPFSTVATWFENTFSTAWQKVKDVFSAGGKIFDGIKDGIADTFKLIVNKLIDGINTIIAFPFNKINGMLNSIRERSIFGTHPFEDLWEKDPLTVPQIPKLAQGGYVKANTPQLAMIGDNRHYGEIVAPEDKMLEMAKKAAELSAGGTSAEVIRLLGNILAAIQRMDTQVVLTGDARQMFKVVQKEYQNYIRRTGKKPF